MCGVGARRQTPSRGRRIRAPVSTTAMSASSAKRLLLDRGGLSVGTETVQRSRAKSIPRDPATTIIKASVGPAVWMWHWATWCSTVLACALAPDLASPALWARFGGGHPDHDQLRPDVVWAAHDSLTDPWGSVSVLHLIPLLYLLSCELAAHIL